MKAADQVHLEYPMLHDSANLASARSQRLFYRLRGTSALLLLLGAFASLLDTPWNGWVAIVAFTLALYVEIASLQIQPEQRWHTARSAAEAVKTLAWRYGVGGAPFGLSSDPSKVDGLFLERLHESIQDLSDLSLAVAHGTGMQITDSMRSLRSASLTDRQRAYEVNRIETQLAWYAGRATSSSTFHDRLSLVSIALAAFGLLLGILQTAGILEVHLWSIVATGGAVTAGWSQTKQHGRNAAAYARAAHELASIRAKLRHVATEHRWARFVEDAESAISREHSVWQASRSD